MLGAMILMLLREPVLEPVVVGVVERGRLMQCGPRSMARGLRRSGLAQWAWKALRIGGRGVRRLRVACIVSRTLRSPPATNRGRSRSSGYPADIRRLIDLSLHDIRRRRNSREDES